MRRPSRRSVVLSTVGLVLAIQLVPIGRDNPPVTATVPAPARVAAILTRACAECHTHDTHWPWYSYVAPVSWLVAHDVHDGRRHLNLSAWSGSAPNIQQKKLLDIIDAVQMDDMPPWYYTPLHPEARLTPDEKNAIVGWAESASAQPAR